MLLCDCYYSEATGRGQTITEDEVKTLFPLWNDALGTEDAKAVTKRYAKKAVLFPLDSDQSRAGKSAIENYYQTWLQEKKPQATVLESHVIIGDDWCQDTGVCEFEFADQSVVKARYSFVYVWEEGAWKISHQHCSAMPEMSTVSAAASSASSSTSGAPTTTTTTSTTTSTSAAPTSTIPSSSTTTSSAASTFPAAEEPAAAEEEE